MRNLFHPGRFWRCGGAVGAVVLIGLVPFACADVSGRRSASRPAWIDLPRESQNDGELHAVGAGMTRDEAIDAAMARLAQAIDVRVVATDQTIVEGESREDEHARSTAARARLRRDIKLISDQRLPGVMVQEVWRDPATETYYARVALDRRAAAERFDAEVGEAARRASLARLEADNLGATWRRLNALAEARSALESALAAAQTRDALAGAYGWSLSRSDVIELSRETDQAWRDARSSMSVSVVAADVDGEKLVDPVSNALASRSVPVQQGGAVVVIRCGLQIEPGRSYDTTRRAATWRATLTAVDVNHRRTLATLRLDGVELARTGVTERSVRAALRKVEDALPSFLDDLFEAR